MFPPMRVRSSGDFRCRKNFFHAKSEVTLAFVKQTPELAEMSAVGDEIVAFKFLFLIDA